MDKPSADEEALWAMLDFVTREALALRSFLEHLAAANISNKERLAKIKNWKREIGLALGHPGIESTASVLQTLRGVPPEARKAMLEIALTEAWKQYL